MSDNLGLPVEEVMEKTSSRQFLVWNRYLEEKWNERSKLDTYLAAIMRAIDSLELTIQRANSKRGKVSRRLRKLEKYYIQFKETSRIAMKKKKDRDPNEQMKLMKMQFGLALGCAPPEDVYNGSVKIHNPDAA